MTCLVPRARTFLLLAIALTAALGENASSSQAATTASSPVLVGIRAAHHPGFDRVVFDFAGSVPSRRNVRYVNRLIADPSGATLPIAHRAILEVTLFPAGAHSSAGRSTAPSRIAFALPNVITLVRSGDFESVVSYGIGLAKRTSFHVSTLSHPSRVVVDISARFQSVLKSVYFLNQRHLAGNRHPFFTRVLRPVLSGTPATALLDRLFAGPTPGEHASGLRLLQSKATGYAGLSVNAQIARLRLSGDCSSGGSTVTIAQEIFPTLKQLSAVRYVKIYDPAGHTEHPSGRRDSIPFCLEP